MPRTMLPAPLWNKLFLFMQQNGLVYNKEEHRLTFGGILYRIRTGIPWCDLPDEFGKWNTVFRRFNAWSKKAILGLLFKNTFARIKHFRAIATRYDKLERNYASMLALAFIIVWLPMWAE
ncbi:transposase [Xenorhabdus sp. SGI246]|uniref:transposase n=1 Tax=Xenorhabdus sp. SGI246 TaxID=3158263 RepID=UPI00349F1B5F